MITWGVTSTGYRSWGTLTARLSEGKGDEPVYSSSLTRVGGEKGEVGHRKNLNHKTCRGWRVSRRERTERERDPDARRKLFHLSGAETISWLFFSFSSGKEGKEKLNPWSQGWCAHWKDWGT